MTQSPNYQQNHQLDHEQQRLAALHEYQILDTASEAPFDDLAQLAASICGTPIALVSLIDKERQWFKARLGLSISETPRDIAFCTYTLYQDDLLIIEDARDDQRFANNPLVTSEPYIRFYAGAPLITPTGYHLGTLCVIDRVPRQLSPQQIEALKVLSRQVINQLELRRNLRTLTAVQQEQQQIRTALQTSEEQFRTAFERAAIGMALVDLDGRCLRVNRSLCSILGYSQAELLTQNFYQLTHPDEPADNQVNLQRLLRGDIPSYRVEKRCLHKHGQAIWLRLNTSLVRDAYGEPTHFIAQVEDLTESKQFEEELQSQNQQAYLLTAITLRIRQSLNLNEILETTVAEVWQFLQADRVVIYRFEEDWNGTVVVESVSPEWTPALGAIIEDTCFKEGRWEKYYRGKIQAIHNVEQTNLSPCHYELLAQFQVKANLVVPIIQGRGATGKQQLWGLLIAHQCSAPRYWRSFEIDFLLQLADQVGIAIAQAHLLEREKKQREQLAERNRALEQARQEAERASEMKSTFLATISHEIRTPMNAVLGMTDLLMDTNLDAQQRDFASTIQTSGETLLNLLNQILDFSKLEAGEMSLEQLDFDLTACIEEVAELLAAPAYAKGLELQSLPTRLKGDENRLRQILTNLINNAIKFTNAGEVLIQAEVATETPTHVTIAFCIIDTGIGIPPVAQQKLFKPFSQVDASTTRRYGGTGLGLAISRQLVELMGGEIGVHSVGSQFWFNLTFEKQTDKELEQVHPHYLNNLERCRLLVVDDNGTNRKIIRYQLAAWGIQVDEADGATAALHLLREQARLGQPYHVAILDMQMPDVVLLRQIKADPDLAAIPLVMMTSLHQRNQIERALSQDVAAYLVKPVKRSRLLDCLSEILATLPEFQQPITSNQCATLNSAIDSSKAEAPQSNLKILLVEDNPVNQKVTLNQLKNLGFTADIVNNGQEALDQLTRQSYDIVLMDCQMPVIDGYEATTILRQREAQSGCHTIIIALTANALKEDQEVCLSVGMDDYLSKPILKDRLSEKINYWSRELRMAKEEDQVQAASSLTDLSNADATTTQPILKIDWEHLHQISDNNPEFERELLQTFAEDTQSRLKAAAAAIAQQNLVYLEHEAHHIKGTTANLGLTEMYEIATKLEKEARDRKLHLSGTYLTQLGTLLNTVQVWLQNH